MKREFYEYGKNYYFYNNMWREISVYSDILNDNNETIHKVDYSDRKIMKYKVCMTYAGNVKSIYCSEIRITHAVDYYNERRMKTLEGKEAKLKYKELCSLENENLKILKNTIFVKSNEDCFEAKYYRNGKDNFTLKTV